MQPCHLSDRKVIAICGPEARGFLQNLVSNDVEKLAPERGLYAVLLSPQGKIGFDFFLADANGLAKANGPAEADGAILLDVAASSGEALLRKLKMYRLRAKVEIAARDELGVYAGLSDEAARRAVNFPDPRHPGLPRRSFAAVAQMPGGLAGAYHQLRWDLGVPEGGDFGFEKIFALDGGLDELHAISFDKGCYVGQELTARMKHRAISRKRPLTVSAAGTLPPPGTAVSQDGDIGEIIASHGERGFASVRLDKWDAARDTQAGGMKVKLSKPAWLG